MAGISDGSTAKMHFLIRESSFRRRLSNKALCGWPSARASSTFYRTQKQLAVSHSTDNHHLRAINKKVMQSMMLKFLFWLLARVSPKCYQVKLFKKATKGSH